MKRRYPSERGSASTELVLLTPLLVILLLFVVGVGRLAGARADVDAAARDAARAASLARSSAAAVDAGQRAASAGLTDGGVICRRLSVTIDQSSFSAGGSVTATVSCVVDLSEVTAAGFPGATTITSSFTAPLDTFRRVDQ